MNSGIILLAHGSRRETANDVLTKLAYIVQDDLSSDKVSRAFLQFSTPNLEESLREQVEAGIKEITVVPVFLFNGIHLEEDIPRLLDSERDKYPEVKIMFAEPVGADRRIGEIIKDRIKEVREGEGVEIIREPAKIEEKSMSIIEEYLEGCDFSYGEKQVVKRVIHATGDPTYAGIMVFSPGAVEKAVELLSRKINLITDVEMVRVGINKPKLEELGGKADCFIHHPEVIKLAGEEKTTRAALSVRWAKEKINGNIMVIGNAPTALFALLNYMERDIVNPAFIIGVPVGFVGSKEAKEELEMQSKVPFITLRGVKGGSPAAVSIVNALINMALNK